MQWNSESIGELSAVTDLLRQRTDLKAMVDGHCDDDPLSLEESGELSRQRPESVTNFLVREGIARERITTRFFRNSYRITIGNSERSHQINRRVEVIPSF